MEYRLVICYDITSDSLREKLHRFLSDYGINSQKSIFEMRVSERDYRQIVEFIEEWIPQAPQDSVRIYELCPLCQRQIRKLGAGLELNPFEYQII